MLNELGIQAHVPTDGHPAFAAWLHLVRRLRSHDDVTVLGLVPTSEKVSGARVGVQLGVALHHSTGLEVTLLDFNTVRPAWENVALERNEGRRRARLFPGVSVVRVDQVTPRVDWTWVREELSAWAGPERYVLCDLSGLQQLSQLEEGLALVHGAISLVRPGRVWEWNLLRLHRRLAGKDLGVLFVEPGPAERRKNPTRDRPHPLA